MTEVRTNVDVACTKCGSSLVVGFSGQNVPGHYTIQVVPCINCTSQSDAQLSKDAVSLCQYITEEIRANGSAAINRHTGWAHIAEKTAKREE